MKLIQTHLVRPTEHGQAHMFTWLDARVDVKVGSLVSLKGETEIWQVAEQYSAGDSSEINRGWGLQLPKSVRTER